MKTFYIFILILININTKFAFAQVQENNHSAFYRTAELTVRQNLPSDVRLNHAFTSITIELSANLGFEDIILLAEGQRFILTKDIHTTLNMSNLIVFDSPISQFQILGKNINTSLKLHLIRVPTLSQKIEENIAYRTENDCEKPAIIAGGQWRTGLTPPKEAPVGTSAKHVIIHHAAGSNTATNFAEVVRNIYVLHTQVNGWNDIGYNYLIAQDGTVFEGRLGQGNLESDNVLGAHFCGKNAGTMGICLLGDYQTAVSPTQATLNVLYKLIAWKLKKESLFNPLASFMHPQGATNASMLGVISGHRDGCNTDCPGENVYKQLAQIRTQVSVACTVLGEEENTFDNELKLYPQPAHEEVFISSKRPINKVVLLDMTGKEIAIFQMNEWSKKISLNNCSSGLYIIKIFGEGKVQIKKMMVEK